MVEDLAGALQSLWPMNNPTLPRSDARDEGGEEVSKWRKESQIKAGQGMRAFVSH